MATEGRCALYSHLGINTAVADHRGVPGNHGVKVERAIHIQRAPSQVYHYWRKLENLPRFISHLRSVEEKGNGRSHWKAAGPVGSVVEWDAETIIDRPGELISWQSIPGSQVDNAGSVWFQPENSGTRVKVAMQYQPPAGALGNVVARLFHRSPGQQLDRDLAAFKDFVESDIDSLS